MKILITCFEPFGIGILFNRNGSQVAANKLKEKYGFEVLTLPVNESCVWELVSKIRQYKPDMIICLGEGPEVRIETKCHNPKEEIQSEFAKELKNKIGFKREEMGDYYCNDIYYAALSRVKKSVFIHVPRFVYFDDVDMIIRRIL